MSYSGNLDSGLNALYDISYNMHTSLWSEAYNGRWSDDVGISYYTYTENLMRTVQSLRGGVDGLRQIEDSLDSINEDANKSRLNRLKEAVNKL